VRVERRRAPSGLLAGVVLVTVALAGWVALIGADPAHYLQQGDAAVYRDAGAAALRGVPIYGSGFGRAGLPFTYPPFAALLFAPLSVVPFGGWQILLFAAGLGSLVLAVWGSLRLAGSVAPGVLLGTVAAALWLEPVGLTFFFGQVNLVLLAVVMVDLARPDSARWKGVGIGIAAGIKLTPLIFVAYLWLSGRRRAAIVAASAFAGTIVVGFGALPSDSADYWSGRFLEAGDAPNRLVNQSLNGALRRLVPPSGSSWLLVCLGLAVAAFGLAIAVAASRSGQELLGVTVTAVTGLLVSPVSWTHHWIWMVPLLGLAAVPEWSLGLRIALGSAVVLLFGWWPLRIGPHGALDATAPLRPSGWLRIAPHDLGQELHWTAGQLVYGNYYVLSGLAFLVLGAFLVARLPVPSRERGGGTLGWRAGTRQPGAVAQPVRAGDS
jgi:alpha-1,2-mannosyltransferase